jgi:hypothetical protein
LAATKRYTRQAEREGTEGRGQRGPRGRRRRAAFTVVGLKMLGDRQRGEEERSRGRSPATVRSGAVGAGGVGTLKERMETSGHLDESQGEGR